MLWRPSSAKTCSAIRFADLPDVLGRPAAGPLQRDQVVGRLRVRSGAQLDQVLDGKSVGSEQADPLAVGELEVDALVALEAAQLEIVVLRTLVHGLALLVPEDVQDRRRHREGQQAATAKQPSALGNQAPWIGEVERAVVAE